MKSKNKGHTARVRQTDLQCCTYGLMFFPFLSFYAGSLQNRFPAKRFLRYSSKISQYVLKHARNTHEFLKLHPIITFFSHKTHIRFFKCIMKKLYYKCAFYVKRNFTNPKIFFRLTFFAFRAGLFPVCGKRRKEKTGPRRDL